MMKLKMTLKKLKPKQKTNIQIKKQIRGCHIKTNVTASFYFSEYARLLVWYQRTVKRYPSPRTVMR